MNEIQFSLKAENFGTSQIVMNVIVEVWIKYLEPRIERAEYKEMGKDLPWVSIISVDS